MKTRYTLKGFIDDMGSFTQPGCTSVEDALWHLNHMREHDNLKPLTQTQFNTLLHGFRCGHANLIPENSETKA